MKRTVRFEPAVVDRLEARVVLSHSAVRHALVTIDGFPSGPVRRQPVSVASGVEGAFASFSSDYATARSAYYASILNVATPAAGTYPAFVQYTKQRVSLLANQVTGSFLQVPQGISQAVEQPGAVRQLVSKKLITPEGATMPGSLASDLVQSTPMPFSSAATASIDSLTQDDAIEAAQVAVLNGVRIVKSGAFGKKSSSHH